MRTVPIVLIAAAILYFSHVRPDVVKRHDSARAGERCRVVRLDHAKYPHILDHVWDAVDKGEPYRLHVDLKDAALHRSQSLRGIPTKHGYDRDEYPPAASREGGTGADVRYVISAENEGSGSSMGAQIRKLKDGACFVFEKRPKR